MNADPDVLSCHCRHCGADFPYLRSQAGAVAECPICKGTVQLPGNLRSVAGIVSRRQNTGPGLALELTGFLLIFWWPWGTLAGIPLILLGFKKGRKFLCSSCEQEITSKTAVRCPNCKAAFLNDE